MWVESIVYNISVVFLVSFFLRHSVYVTHEAICTANSRGANMTLT